VQKLTGEMPFHSFIFQKYLMPRFLYGNRGDCSSTVLHRVEVEEGAVAGESR